MPVFGKETEGGQEADMRVEQAEKAMQNFLDRFYVVDEDNDRGEIVGEFFWTRAEMFEVVVDAYEKTGEEKYKDLMAQMYRGFVKSYGEEWSDNDFNDDIMWMTIGCARAYELTGETFYKEQAEHHFKLVFDRAWNDDLGGGLLWKTDQTCKNACINGPAAIAGCLLYRITKEEDYLEKAKQIYQWQLDTLCQGNGAVSDNIESDGKINTWCSTYNQGTFIGASQLLWELTGEQKYLDEAILAADYTMHEMFHDGVINTEAEGNDLPGFKGILARWLGKLVNEGGQEQYREWTHLGQAIQNGLEDAVQTGLSPEGESGKEIAALHRRWLTVTGNHYDPDLHRGLAELYVSDGRFTAYYDKTIPGCARFLRDAIACWASKI